VCFLGYLPVLAVGVFGGIICRIACLYTNKSLRIWFIY
jgi:hypothetical protein